MNPENQRRPDLGNGYYQNPILGGDYPDPSVLRVDPSIKKWGDTYYLYYFGATYDEPYPAPDEQISHERYVRVWNRKCIGLATSKSVVGPWTRPDQPFSGHPAPWHNLYDLQIAQRRWRAVATGHHARRIRPGLMSASATSRCSSSMTRTCTLNTLVYGMPTANFTSS
jgi:hypothetical protein